MQNARHSGKAGVQEAFLNRINNAWIPVSTGMTESDVLLRFCITLLRDGVSRVALRLDSGRLDHVRPRPGFGLDAGGELRPACWSRPRGPDVPSLCHVGQRQRLDRRLAQAVYDAAPASGRHGKAYHELTSKPGNPDSEMVGSSGATFERFRPVVASAFNLPAFT